MINKYEIRDDTVYIQILNKQGETIETLIDNADLNLVNTMPTKWYFTHDYVRGFVRVPSGVINISFHRLITGAPKGYVVDHINHNTLDNRRSNLRVVTDAENAQNRRAPNRNNTSGVRGVIWRKSHRKWEAGFALNKKHIYVGLYETVDEAEKAITEARAKLQPYSKESSMVKVPESKKVLREKNDPYRHNKSGVKNVSWDGVHKLWKVVLRRNHKIHHYGYYKTIEEARKVAEEKRKLLDQ